MTEQMKNPSDIHRIVVVSPEKKDYLIIENLFFY